MPQRGGSPAPRRRRWPWFVRIGLLIWLGGAYFFYQDNEKRFAEARNTGVDILSTDEKTGVVTARDRKTGKIIKMDFNDIEPDQVRVGAIGMPSWIPSYPNSSASTPPGNGAFSLSTSDTVSDVAGFYQQELQKSGMSVARRNSVTGNLLAGVTLTAKDTAKNRSVKVVIKRQESDTNITITPGTK
jgi:hypothetical protein